MIPRTNAHAAERSFTGNPICWRERKDDGAGQPLRFPTCEWCGSMTPQQFVAFLALRATVCEVADWKYGYPHKIYVTTPNPEPDELRECGSTSEGCKPQYNADGACTHYIKTQDAGPAGFTEWSDRCGWHYKSTYPVLTLKFYTAHLADLPDLSLHADLILRHTGIRFTLNAEGRLMYQRAQLTK